MKSPCMSKPPLFISSCVVKECQNLVSIWFIIKTIYFSLILCNLMANLMKKNKLGFLVSSGMSGGLCSDAWLLHNSEDHLSASEQLSVTYCSTWSICHMDMPLSKWQSDPSPFRGCEACLSLWGITFNVSILKWNKIQDEDLTSTIRQIKNKPQW